MCYIIINYIGEVRAILKFPTSCSGAKYGTQYGIAINHVNMDSRDSESCSMGFRVPQQNI